MRNLKVNLEDLTLAFDSSFDDTSNYLDLTTGEVVAVTDEIRHQLEEILEGSGAETLEAVNEAISNEAGPEWLQQALQEAAVVEFEYNTRLIAIPRADSRSGYRAMQDFIGTVEDTRLKERLEEAIQGRGAFRRFKDAIGSDQPERERWFRFYDERLQQQVLDWLKAAGIQLSA